MQEDFLNRIVDCNSLSYSCSIFAFAACFSSNDVGINLRFGRSLRLVVKDTGLVEDVLGIGITLDAVANHNFLILCALNRNVVVAARVD